jgi:transcription factor C subunit 7
MAATLVKALLADKEFPLSVGCCSITELTRKCEDGRLLGGWEVARLADGSFLKEGALRPWGFEKSRVADKKVCLCE